MYLLVIDVHEKQPDVTFGKASLIPVKTQGIALIRRVL
jgi:hypothetical protein